MTSKGAVLQIYLFPLIIVCEHIAFIRDCHPAGASKVSVSLVYFNRILPEVDALSDFIGKRLNDVFDPWRVVMRLLNDLRYKIVDVFVCFKIARHVYCNSFSI